MNAGQTAKHDHRIVFSRTFTTAKALVLLCGLAVSAACTKARVSEHRIAPTGIGPQDAVVVVLDKFSHRIASTDDIPSNTAVVVALLEFFSGPSSGDETHREKSQEDSMKDTKRDAKSDKEKEIGVCIGDAILKGHPEVRIVSPEKFRRATFGSFDVAPKPWGDLIKEVRFRERGTAPS